MFAPEGLPFIVGSAGLAVGVLGLGARTGAWPLWVLGGVLLVVALWVAWFFRDPVRTGARGPGVVVAPADGRVVLITPVHETTFVHGPTVRVSIFMNVFDVHVNRYPLDGIVEFVERRPGKFLNAVTEASSVENEQNAVGLVSGPHRILMRQIAGLVARRIITDPAPGAVARQGERFGLIRFGSRVDLFLPPDAHLHVRVGDRTRAGATVVAELPAA